MFYLETEIWDNRPVHIFKNKKGVSCTVFSGASGAIQNTYLLHENQPIQVTYGAANQADWLSNGHTLYLGNLLFPFPNRIKNGQYTWEDKVYELPINEPTRNNAIHGLVAFETFEIGNIKLKSEFAQWTLSYNLSPYRGYPFQVSIQTDYLLKESELNAFTQITSLEKKVDIPVGLGWHPYFTLPGNRKDWILHLPKASELEIDAQLIPNMRIKDNVPFCTPKALNDVFLDAGYVLHGEKNATHTTRLSHGTHTLEIIQRGYPFLQIYTPPSANAIAIEPMTCAANAFNNKMGLEIIKPNTTITVYWAFRLL